jgi:hypothetical protein
MWLRRVVFGAVLVAAATQAAAALPRRIEVRGDALALYPFSDGTTLLAANGHVRVNAGPRSIQADAVRFDLNANRLVAAGHVVVSSAGEPPLHAAAYALDLARDTATYLSLEPMPTVLTLRGTLPAREGPPDPATFAVADLSQARPYVRARRASIEPNANVRLSPSTFSTGAGPPFTTPNYLYTFARTNFSQTSLPGATFDQPYPLFGTANSLTSLHLRYDTVEGAGAGIDERLVDGNRAYASASILPLHTQQFALNTFEQLRRGVTQSLDGFYDYGPNHDVYTNYALQWTNPSSRLSFSAYQFDSTNHAGLTLGSIDHFVAPLFTYKVQVGYGYDHVPGELPFANAYSLSTYGYVASPTLHGPFGIGTSVRYDYSLQQYDFPHEVTSGTASLILSRAVNRSLSFFGTVTVNQTADRYRDDAGRYLGLPDPSVPYYAPDGTPYPGFFAYAGLNTYRTQSLQTTWRPRGGENSLQLFVTHTDDFPQFHGYGRPPLYLTLDVTERLGSTLRVDLARSYSFGWNRQYLSPQWQIGISP